MDGLKNGMESNMDGLKNGMEAKMDGVEANMDDMEANIDGIEGNMEDLKKDMEGLKEGLAKLLQEKLPNGEKVVEETHDENQINVGLKTYHITNINMRNFDGKDLITWILQMEQYCENHNTQNT